MSHELSHDPIKLRIVDITNGTYAQSYIWVGTVPGPVEKELKRVEKLYNGNKTVQSLVLKKFYGPQWKGKLGMAVDKNTKTGGSESGGTKIGGGSKQHEFSELAHSISGGDDFVIDDDMMDFTSLEPETEPETIPDAVPVKKLFSSEIEITSEELEQLDSAEPTIDIFAQHESTAKIERTGDINFVFGNVFPSDNILDFKYKIYLLTGIPIYRQHLWLKYKQRSVPCHYNITLHKHVEQIDIESLIKFYQKETTADEILGCPIVQDFYRNKSFLQVVAEDEFNLLYTNWTKYNTAEYFLADLSDFIDGADLYSKIGKDRYQLEVLYYGFIVLYWPMMTFTIFTDWIKNEKSIREIYPDLAPDKAMLRHRYETQEAIVLESYEAYESKDRSVKSRLFSSITETIVSIDNHKQDIELLLILRNIFDMIELTETMTYCKAHILHEGQSIVLRKSFMNEKEPKDIIPLNSLLIKIKTAVDTIENIRLVLFKNGNYIIRTEWREENHMDFKKIIEAVADKINPIIAMINSAGSKMKYFDVAVPKLSSKNVVFTETGLTFYFDDDLTDSRFTILKHVLEDFRRAGIIGAKESLVNTQLDYFFNAGMYKFDVMRIEKAISLENYYSYLSAGIIKQKWSTIFGRTRSFTVSNIGGKLKISINGIKNDTEMEFFYLYLIGLLTIYSRQAQSVKVIADETLSTKSKKALKNLKLQDPLLYDFKKIYKSNIIYSKICQKPYQPIMLNDAEYKTLSKEKRARAVRYWNYTKEKPVWYSCPNMKFPYVKFIVKQHPKDYCIPCCKKIAMNENVNKKKQEIHNTCLSGHKYTGEKVNLTKGSHYVATYGKDIEVGRICRLPEHTLEPLFFDTYSPEGSIDAECIKADGYYLFGLEQHLPTVELAGYFYCLMHAFNRGGIDEFLAETVKRIRAQPEKVKILLEGQSSLFFTNSDELCDVLLMLNKDTVIANKFSVVPWNELFISIAYYYFGINTVFFDDQHKERIGLVLPKGLKAADEMFPAGHKNLVVLRKKTKWYPIYLLNVEIFKRTGLIESRLFLNESGLVTIIRAVVKRYFESVDFEKIKSKIDLSVVKHFTKHTDYKISACYINNINLCYAVELYKGKHKVWIPISTSHYPLENNLELRFEPFTVSKDHDLGLLLGLTADYNRWVRKTSVQNDLGNANCYPLMTPEKWLTVRGSTQVIGFLAGSMYYYCSPVDLKNAMRYHKLPVATLLYDPTTVNKMIFKAKNTTRNFNMDPMISADLQIANYRYHLYSLVLLQFMSIFNQQRNTKLRKEIVATVAKTNLEKNMDAVRKLIDKIAVNYTEDAAKIKAIISRYVISHHDKKQLLEDISESYFDFDKVELDRLKQLDQADVYVELQSLAKKFVKIGTLNKAKFKFPNILVSCSEVSKQSADYCHGKQFIIEKKQLDEILRILAADITNPMKLKWMFNSIFINKTVNFFKFIRRAGETITVEFM